MIYGFYMAYNLSCAKNTMGDALYQCPIWRPILRPSSIGDDTSGRHPKESFHVGHASGFWMSPLEHHG